MAKVVSYELTQNYHTRELIKQATLGRVLSTSNHVLCKSKGYKDKLSAKPLVIDTQNDWTVRSTQNTKSHNVFEGKIGLSEQFLVPLNLENKHCSNNLYIDECLSSPNISNDSNTNNLPTQAFDFSPKKLIVIEDKKISAEAQTTEIILSPHKSTTTSPRKQFLCEIYSNTEILEMMTTKIIAELGEIKYNLETDSSYWTSRYLYKSLPIPQQPLICKECIEKSLDLKRNYDKIHMLLQEIHTLHLAIEQSLRLFEDNKNAFIEDFKVLVSKMVCKTTIINHVDTCECHTCVQRCSYNRYTIWELEQSLNRNEVKKIYNYTYATDNQRDLMIMVIDKLNTYTRTNFDGRLIIAAYILDNFCNVLWSIILDILNIRTDEMAQIKKILKDPEAIIYSTNFINGFANAK